MRNIYLCAIYELTTFRAKLSEIKIKVEGGE
jgi:hypothetical protein